MENIEGIKKKYIEFFSKKYYSKEKEELTEIELNRCSLLAELWAYVYSVIPEGYGKYTIFNFDGNIPGKANNRNIISNDIILSVREKICDYCWNLKWEEINKKKNKEESFSFLRKNSAMMKRFHNGSNIVIFGSSEKPIGRTMLASIVMKEAIKLRITHLDRSQTYDWIDFSKLFNAIEKDSMDLSDYKSCDWLVVDNISRTMRSQKQTTLMVDLIDPFFIDRYRKKQPTILVFKFDIREKSSNIEKTFGVGINRIINSKRTLKIPLCEDLLNTTDG
jgi:DNA replication protein DnaC